MGGVSYDILTTVLQIYMAVCVGPNILEVVHDLHVVGYTMYSDTVGVPVVPRGAQQESGDEGVYTRFTKGIPIHHLASMQNTVPGCQIRSA